MKYGRFGASVACERRRISGCRFSRQPEIRLRSQARVRVLHFGADYTRQAGQVTRAGSLCRVLGTSVKHTINQLCDYIGNSQPGQLGFRYRDAGIPASQAENLPCNRDYRANTFSLRCGIAEKRLKLICVSFNYNKKNNKTAHLLHTSFF